MHIREWSPKAYIRAAVKEEEVEGGGKRREGGERREEGLRN